MGKNSIKNLFGSKTRIKLLELFFTHPDQSYYVREITRMIDEQINSVRRELANLLSIQLIKKDERDNKVFYGVNQKFKNYVAFAMIFDDNFDKSSLSKNTMRELEQEAKITPVMDDTKFDWQKAIVQIDDELQVAILAGHLVPESTSQVDLLLVGDDSQGKISNWASGVEKSYGSDLAYSILTYDEFVYRMSIRDQFVMDVLSGHYCVIRDIPGIIKEKIC